MQTASALVLLQVVSLAAVFTLTLHATTTTVQAFQRYQLTPIMTATSDKQPFSDTFVTLKQQLTTATTPLFGTSSTSNSNNLHNDTKQYKTVTLYMIRHAEAAHNVEEAKAQAQALQQCLSRGLSANSPETLLCMETARQKVLEDLAFFDAPLSENGIKQAKEAARAVEQLKPYPTEILVSPLHRALQTANLIFPVNSNVSIHAREELRERVTGRPADNRASSRVLEHRKSFSRISFETLRWQSMMNLGDDMTEYNQFGITRSSSQNTNDYSRESSFNASELVEDEEKLRERTLDLLHLLMVCEGDAVAIVTHKGYLRSLEQGLFDNPDATCFDNCELRVYRLELQQECTDTVIVKTAKRLY